MLTWLMVGWTQPVWMAWIVAIASMPPAAPRQCPIMLLVAFILMCDRSEKTCGGLMSGGGLGGGEKGASLKHSTHGCHGRAQGGGDTLEGAAPGDAAQRSPF